MNFRGELSGEEVEAVKVQYRDCGFDEMYIEELLDRQRINSIWGKGAKITYESITLDEEASKGTTGTRGGSRKK